MEEYLIQLVYETSCPLYELLPRAMAREQGIQGKEDNEMFGFSMLLSLLHKVL